MESVHVCSIQIASHLAPSCLRPLGLLAMASVKSMIAASLLAAPCADAFVAPGASQSSHSVTGLRGSTAVKAESGFSTYSALASATTGAAVLSFASLVQRSRLPARLWLASLALRHRSGSPSLWDSLIRPASARTRLPSRTCEPRSSSMAESGSWMGNLFVGLA